MPRQKISWRTRKLYKKVMGMIISYAVLASLGTLFLLPLAWMISTSLKPNRQIFLFPPIWIPHPIDWSHYPNALQFIPFFTYLKNTLMICVFSVVGVVLSCSLVAYGFSRVEWPERDLLFILVLSTMMIPYAVTMIPLYLVFNRLGWVNTFKPLIVPAYFGNPFFIFLLRQFFLTIPFELSDAARIDGASEIRIFSRIILPLAKPVLAVVVLFQFIGSWNDFLGPLIYLKDQSKYTLAIGLQQFQSAYLTRWGMLMAATTLIVMPIIILFFFTQRTFIQGIAITGLKQ